ncbi:MAG: type IV pilus secretin PilQ [Bacteriovoracaceae bacterium]
MKKGIFQYSILSLILMSYSAVAQEVKAINFLQEGEVSKLVIDLDKPVIADRFHITEDKQIILDLKNTKASAKVLRGIDTSEFPGSAVYISGYKKPGSASDVRFAIQLRDNVRSILENNGTKLTLSIENRFGVFSKNKIRTAEEPTVASSKNKTEELDINIPKSMSIEDILENLTLSGPKKYVGKRISINVQDIPISDILKMIADTSGFNIIIDQEIAKLPPLTLTLTNVPWDQALDTIMNLSKLVAQKSSNILLVKTLEQATREKETELKAAQLKEGLEPLVTKVFLINYATLADISKIIKDYITPQRASIQIDERTNSLIIRDTVDSIERIKKIVETLDNQTPQVLIEAKIVEANESYSKRIGLTRGFTMNYRPFGDIAAANGSFTLSSAPTADAATALGATFNVYKRIANLDFNLQLMESESKGRIISTPKVITQNKKEATITSSEQTSFQVTQIQPGATTPIITFQNISADLNLKVKPQITSDGSISMDINLSKSAFTTRPSDAAPPNISRRSVNTTVLVDNGSTVVIGGLYQTQSLEQQSGVPFLKDLPLVGWLFRTPYAPTTSKNELIIFMTPRIINQDEAGFVERQAVNQATDT